MTDKELIQELRSKAEVEGAGSTRRLLELAARALERRQWVSVKDRLPEDGASVLGVINAKVRGTKWERSIAVVYYEHHFGWFLDAEYTEDEVRDLSVMYWMPLPEPPKEVTEDA